MAHTNQTPNYELSQFLGTDKPAWLVDYNGDMEKIDLGLKAAKDVADAAKEEADQGAIDIAAVTLTANTADAKASGAVSNMADAYDATSTYNVGDFVIYSNILYRCITTITVPESFDGTHWERTTVEEIIDSVNSDLTWQLLATFTHTTNNTTQTFNMPQVGQYSEYVIAFSGACYANNVRLYLKTSSGGILVDHYTEEDTSQGADTFNYCCPTLTPFVSGDVVNIYRATATANNTVVKIYGRHSIS